MAKRRPIIAAIAAAVFVMSPAIAQTGSGRGGSSVGPTTDGLDGGVSADSPAALKVDEATIRQVQQRLEGAGYDVGTVDGSWDQQSQQALSDWQRANGLQANGQLDAQTLTALGIGGEGEFSAFQNERGGSYRGDAPGGSSYGSTGGDSGTRP